MYTVSIVEQGARLITYFSAGVVKALPERDYGIYHMCKVYGGRHMLVWTRSVTTTYSLLKLAKELGLVEWCGRKFRHCVKNFRVKQYR